MSTTGDSPDHGQTTDLVGALERRFEATQVRRDGWTLVIMGFAVFALVASALAVSLGWRAIDESKSNAAGGSETVSTPTSVMVELADFTIKPADMRVAEGGTLEVMNAGAVVHNLVVRDEELKTSMLPAGGSEALVLTGLAAGDYTLFCEIPGHEAAGMKAALHVGGGSGSEPASGSTGSGDGSTGGSADGATIDFTATPAPEWHAFDPALQPAPGATVHDVTFHATETTIEVAPGVTQQLWTFNDQVPGPTLRGHVGDVFNITLVNDGKIGHSIDFHASEVAPDVEMRTIDPGQSLVYQFKADHAGIWMYHCGTPPILHHIGNGMYGAVIIDPPGLPAVDHEYLMVQSELYLGPDGQPGDLTKMAAEQADAVVFNGYVSQYKHAPIRVEPGQTVRVWVLDAGPNENSSFHIVGTIFDTVYKEGAYLLRPDSTLGGAQALDLQPAQGGFVEFTLDRAGLYPMVTHKFANVGKGALGIFQAGDVTGTASH
jgi:nitrite reductase (NO-forming)